MASGDGGESAEAPEVRTPLQEVVYCLLDGLQDLSADVQLSIQNSLKVRAR